MKPMDAEHRQLEENAQKRIQQSELAGNDGSI